MANKENIRKWVTALRSGEYEQGREALRNGDKFCCLGVACDVALEDGLALRHGEDDAAGHLYDDNPSFLPSAVMDWLGLDPDSTGTAAHAYDNNIVLAETPLGFGVRRVFATEANDELEWDFNQIADAIETRYLTE